MAGETAGSAPEGLHLRARAKVNLYLHVTGRRPDGYHELDSLMVFPDVGDELFLARRPGFSLEMSGPFATAVAVDGPDNLVFRAARGLQDRLGAERLPGAYLRLQKRLPVAAGIGGGSADAAATLRGLIRLWDLEVADAELQSLALELGADVPPCLASRPVFARGIGEILTPTPPLPSFWLVLVNPGVPVQTPAVFQARQGAFSVCAEWTTAGDLDALLDLLAATRNDLEPPALALEPQIGAVLDALRAMQACRLARMSGSGATCFGIFGEAAAAAAAAAALSSAHPGWWVAAAPVDG